jgi:glycosyltransferase involved in cell wall biosynthesis
LRILSYNFHAGYDYLLAKLDAEFLLTSKWNDHARPKPDNCNVIGLEKADKMIENKEIDFVLVHSNIHRGSMVKALKSGIPSAYLAHSRNESYTLKKQYYFSFYLNRLKRNYPFDAVFIRWSNKCCYNLDGVTILHGIDTSEFGPWNPQTINLVTVSHAIKYRDHIHPGFLQLAAQTGNFILIGAENEVDGAQCVVPNNFTELKDLYSSNLAYLNLLTEPESGSNLALLEAMATGMPIITIRHPESPISHRWNGMVIEEPEEFEHAYNELILNKDFAHYLGQNARKTIELFYNINTFKKDWTRFINKLMERAGKSVRLPMPPSDYDLAQKPPIESVL